MKIISAKSGNNGLAIGKLLLYTAFTIPVPEKTSDIVGETKRLRNAIGCTYDSYNEQLNRCKNEKNDKIEQWYAMTATQTDAVKAALDGDESFERFVTVWNQYLADYEAFDDFDTRVGLDPDFYEPQMAASVFITGEQVTPSQPIPSQP